MKKRAKILTVIILSLLILACLEPLTGLANRGKSFSVMNSSSPSEDHGYILVTYAGSSVAIERNAAHTFTYVSDAESVMVDFISDTGYQLEYYVIGNDAEHLKATPFFFDAREYAGGCACHDTVYIKPKWAAVSSFTINTSVSAGGAITPDQTVVGGSDCTISYSAYAGYHLSGVTADGADVTHSNPESYTFTNVTSDHSISAVYETDIYNITYDLNGGISDPPNPETYTVETSGFTLNNPVKPGCEFAGWTGTGLTGNTLSVTIPAGSCGDREYTANWDTSEYTVTFSEGAHGSTAGQKIFTGLHYGDPFPAAPEITPETGWMFDGWPKMPAEVTGDASYTAAYTQAEYTVTFDAGTSGTTTDPASFSGLHYGDTFPTAPNITPYPGWTFDYWSPTLPSVVENSAIYTAHYTQIKFTVTFKDYDNTILKICIVKYGSGAAAPADPGNREGFHFIGWDVDFSIVKSDLTVTAQYAINTYRVRFFEEDGKTQIGTSQTVNRGAAAKTETAPVIAGKTFERWKLKGDDPSEATSLGCVKENIYATAAYSDVLYIVTFIDFNGRCLGIDRVPYGGSAIPPSDPSRKGYRFKGWSQSYFNIIGDITVAALYDINFYTVTFIDYDGSVIDKQTVEWNAGAVAPECPARDGYAFTGWDVPYNRIRKNTVVTAEYEAIAAAEQTPLSEIGTEPIPQTGGSSRWLWWLLLIPAIVVILIIASLRRTVIPVAEALTDNGNGTYTVHWGYNNRKHARYKAGEDRSVFSVISGKLIMSSANPPVEFKKGRAEDVFTTIVDKDTEVQWRINRRKAKVDLKKLD